MVSGAPFSFTQAHFRLGFVPLVDAAPLVVAAHRGIFARHGLQVDLVPCASWASLRDRLAFGVLEGAAMLAPMPIATNLGLGGVEANLRVIGTLSYNGNAITLGAGLLQEIRWAAPGLCDQRPLPAKALAAALAARHEAGREKPTLAVVFPFSSHNYLLRAWLASAGIDPERDVRLVVVPPPQVAERLASGEIDGFCAGAPWSSRAVELRAGEVVCGTAEIWPDHPEKILAVREECLETREAGLVALMGALSEAGRWLDRAEADELNEAARLLATHGGLAMPVATIAGVLAGRITAAPDHAPIATARFHFGKMAPDPAHGLRWLSEMRRWGHVPEDTRDEMIDRVWTSRIWQQANAGQEAL